jgi:polyhydroxybutyrate depolymerase
MRSSVTLLFTLLSAGGLYGQIAISSEDYVSPLGDTIISHNANLFNVFPPAEGANQTWDYRWLELLNPQSDPEPEGSDENFPTANNIDETPFPTAFNAEATVPVRFFERYDAGGKTILGSQVAIPVVIPYDCEACTPADSIRFEAGISVFEEPEQVFQLPLNFEDTWSSTYSRTIDMTLFSPTFSLNDVPAQQSDTVRVTSEVTGWGTLALPNLTRSGFQDMEVLMVRTTRTLKSHFFINGMPAPQALLDGLGLTQGQETTTTEYHFFAKNLDRPALSLTFTVQGIPIHASVAGRISDINPDDEGQFFPQGMLHDGNPRAYYVYLPPGYTGAEPTPVVVALHGYTSYATQFAWQSQMNVIADTAGFMVVYPQGLLVNNPNSAPFPPQGPGWNVPGTALTSQNDDVDFINTVVEEVANQFNVDLARVYATGISNGGFMTSVLACASPERFAAVAMAAGTLPCERARNIPTFIIHGTNDLVVPFAGRAELGAPPVPETVAFYAGQNGCTATPDSTNLPDIDMNDGTTVTKFTYAGCQEDGDVVFYRVNNGGHVWEGTGPVPPLFQPILGAFVNQDISASSEIWNFFNRHVVGNVVSTKAVAPGAFQLQVYPNPFSSNLTFEFELPQTARVQLSLLNTLGQPVARIADQELPRGKHRLEWQAEGNALPAGLYFYRLRIGDRLVSRPVVFGR